MDNRSKRQMGRKQRMLSIVGAGGGFMGMHSAVLSALGHV